eukprot:scaffold162668_cov67-Attheya_sp.AAC.2
MDHWVEICAKEKLNLHVISASQPGFGYSIIQPGHKNKNWSMTDMLPILKKESVKEFVVTVISFESPHACAMAAAFGKNDEGSLENIQQVKEDLGAELTEILATGCNRSVDIPENIPLVLWYADNDEYCSTLHGEYLDSGKFLKK